MSPVDWFAVPAGELSSALGGAMSELVDGLWSFLIPMLPILVLPFFMLWGFKWFKRLVVGGYDYVPSVAVEAQPDRRQLRAPEPLHIEDKKLCSCELCKPTDPQLVARMLSTTPPSIDEWNGWADYSKRSVKR